MKINLTLTLATLGLATNLCASTVELDTGRLELGGLLEADRLVIGPAATLAGDGRIAAPAAIAGTLAPSGTLTFGSTLAFASGATLVSRVTSNTQLDTLVVAGAVSGAAQVILVQTTGAIPLSQTFIAGGASSDYAGVAPAASNAWALTASGNNLLITDLLGDSQGDGLKDWWRMQHFSVRTGVDKDADGDHDGMNNEAEYVAGTDPTNSASLLVITGFAMTREAEQSVAWPSVAGRVYGLECTTNLLESFVFLPDATNLSATPPVNVYTNTSGTGIPQLFYRVRVWLAP